MYLPNEICGYEPTTTRRLLNGYMEASERLAYPRLLTSELNAR